MVLLTWYIKYNEIYLSGRENMIRKTNTTMSNFEHHLAQMLKLIEERLSSYLPSYTEVNPKESLRAITFRSGKQLPRTKTEQ